MFGLILLPFRGLIWLFQGIICSLPWLVIILPATVHYWLPYVISYRFEKNTSFPCRVGSADVNLLEGKVTLKNVVVYNSPDFNSSDFLKLKEIRCTVTLTSLFQQTLQLQDLHIICNNITSVMQSGVNNLQSFCEHCKVDTNKGFLIKDFSFEMDGWVDLRNYGTRQANAVAVATQNSFKFENLCINASAAVKQDLLDSTSSLEQVYEKLNTLFSK